MKKVTNEREAIESMGQAWVVAVWVGIGLMVIAELVIGVMIGAWVAVQWRAAGF